MQIKPVHLDDLNEGYVELEFLKDAKKKIFQTNFGLMQNGK